MRDYSKSKLPAVINPPDYSTLLNWWESWPEARPELLDFWGRGNYTRRLLSRKKLGRSGCIVRVNYVDEIESSLRRLALLDVDVDYAWHGTTIGPQLTLLPQDIDYEDSGGWGYLVAAGDKFSENRSGKEWCPSIGFAALLPDTVTDWLSSNAFDYIKEGKIIVCPAINIGLEEKIGYRSEEYIQKLSDSASIIREMAKLKTLFSVELPYIEGMSIPDIYKFCQDNKDSLILFQIALSKLIKSSIIEMDESEINEIILQIKQGVAELRLSDKTNKARKLIAGLGASISTFLITVGINLGVDLGSAAIGSTGAALATLAFWYEILKANENMRKNPFYIIWKLQKGKGPKDIRREREFLKEFELPKTEIRKETPPHHWLTPPTGGWLIPSAKSRIA